MGAAPAAAHTGEGVTVSLRELSVIVAAPAGFVPRAAWVLDTLLAQLGCRAVLIDQPEHAPEPCFAYASSPVPGVPTLPCSCAAMNLLAAGEPLPRGSYSIISGGDGDVVGAFACDNHEHFAVAFDLVASAFALLSCWDERTSDERDSYGRLPYSASIFAANSELDISRPAVDRYVEVLRGVVAPRLQQLDEPPLPPPGWMWADGNGNGPAGDGMGTPFALALTHDLDNLWRWTPRGFAAAAYRTLRSLLTRDPEGVYREVGDFVDWLARHLPRGSDPYWTFPQILSGEDARGVTSTFFIIARHTHATDGNQPHKYQKLLPAALRTLREGRREVGLHGNDSDRTGFEALCADRSRLQRASGGQVEGMRYHYLRCLYHETLPMLEKAGFAYDTSLAFAEREGYRCACSFPFRPYSLDEERPLDIVELPLAVMDGTLQQAHYRGLPAVDAERAALAVLQRAARSGGAASVLWHNNRFDRRISRGYDGVYWRLLDQLLAQGARVGSAGEIVARWREAMDGPDTRQIRTRRAVPPSARRSSSFRASVRILHMSVVHKPDDPRIYERECHALADAGYAVAYLSPGADGGLDGSGVLRVPLPLRSRRTRFLNVAGIVQALRVLRPHVVHIHDPELLTLFPVLKSRVPRLVYDMHEYVPEAVAGKPYIPAPVRPLASGVTAVAQRRLAALADGAVVVTPEQLAALDSCPSLRLVLPNYPRIGRFAPVQPVIQLAADSRLKLMYVGSLSRARGCTMMLDVMEQLDAKDAVLYLGGTFNDPALEIEVRARLAAGLEDRVRILGRIPPPELPHYLAAADVVWVPSLPDRQYRHPTIPTKLLEGMAMGRAVLVSDMPGRGDLVRREACGIAVPPGVEGHLGAVRHLLASRQEIRTMGERGRGAVELTYSWEAVAGDLVEFYDALCSGLRVGG